MPYLFTSESVSEGHPDKIADQISDALLDEFIRQDKNSKVALETLVTTGLVVLAGEVTTNAWVDVQTITRNIIRHIGYVKPHYRFDSESCGIISTIHEQSPDIRRGVERGNILNMGAGDQGIMFGYAVKEAGNLMPYSIELAHFLLQELAEIRREGKFMTYLGPDAKSQVTIKYNKDNTPVKVHTIVISTQHDEFIKPKNNSAEAIAQAEKDMLERIRTDIINILIPRIKAKLDPDLKKFFNGDFHLLVNPTGKFVIGGPHGDTGLTGRKIIVDTYGGHGAHGGGAFSGKDPSKVDRSASYAMRHIAKNAVAAGIADKILVQVSYAIGVAEPVGFFVNTFETAKVTNKYGQTLTDAEIAERLFKLFDLRPGAIIQRLKLLNPIYFPTASYGHFGRTPFTKKTIVYENNKPVEKEIEFFTWEKLDMVDQIQKEFAIK